MQFDVFRGLLNHKHKVVTATPGESTLPVEVIVTPPTNQLPTITVPTVSQAMEIGYGNLYNHFAVTDSRGLAPVGWRIPTPEDFDYLVANAGQSPAIPLKEAGDAYWMAGNNGTNASGLSLRGGGSRDAIGNFVSFRGVGRFATDEITQGGFGGACFEMFFNQGIFYRYPYLDRHYGFSVIYIKETSTLQEGETGTVVGNDGTIYPTICYHGQEWTTRPSVETKYRNLDAIPLLSASAAWSTVSTGATCYFANNQANAFANKQVSIEDAVNKVDGLFVNESFTGICVLTQAEYDALAVVSPAVLYFIK
jgi:uncharacterized protein (TIGR02145 family)